MAYENIKNKDAKVDDILDELNVAVNRIWLGKRIEDSTSFHESIKEIANPILEKYGMEIEIWRACEKGDIDKILIYSLNYDQDKRYKNGMVGRVKYIEFLPALEVRPGATLQELLDVIRKEEIEEHIERLAREKEEHEQELKEINQYLAEYREELKAYS
ncbi:hypothetical protein AB3N02_22035 [Priestia aryabhattai]|uniref:hypothetical protein n=1 Tax=Priestia aryabhattai TaxID=412384 RepID=UPI0039A39D9D